MIDLFGYALKEALSSFSRTRMMSMVSILVIGISLFTLGLFLLLSLNVKHILTRTQQKIEIVAYLEDNVSESNTRDILLKIRSIENVGKIEFVSKDDALKKFREDFSDRENLIKSIPFNPLPASFQIHLAKYEMQGEVVQIANEIAKIDGVEDVVFGRKWLSRLDRIFRTLKSLSLVVGILIAVGSVFVISNTIKLTVLARRNNVEIMKLVGATNWFIRLPFIIEGILYGAFGSVFALGLIYAFYFGLIKNLRR